MKGTLLNAATVTAGGVAGALAGRGLPAAASDFALGLLGLVTLANGATMFARSRKPVVVVGALAIGAAIGWIMNLQGALDGAGEALRRAVSGGGRFTEGFVAATVLFCVGPLTILGCLEDGLTGSSPLLALKSALDGVAGFFLAAGFGIGVPFAAISVLVIQGAMTLAARRLAFLRDDEAMIAEIAGVGGPIVVGIGLGLLAIKRLPLADTLPSLALAPLFVGLSRRLAGRTKG